MKASFRIICLKNDQSRKYQDGRIKNNNIIVPFYEIREKIDSKSFIPNLVHLSARLQDDSRQNQSSQTHKSPHQSNFLDQKIQLTDQEIKSLPQKRAQELKRLKQMQIQKFFESKQSSIQKQKNTMKSLLGEINFSLNKKKERKISRMIKSNIKDGCSSERSNKKHQLFDNSASFQNKVLLQSDFHKFLANKQQQNSAPVEENEDIKLNRLSMINPEHESAHSARDPLIKPLNLFHFQEKKSAEKKINFKQTNRILSSTSVKADTKSRLEKLMFRFQANQKTEEQEFQWSKLRDKSFNHKNFTLRTLDL